MRRLLAAGICAAALALVSGCGGDSETPSTATSAATTTTAPAATAQDSATTATRPSHQGAGGQKQAHKQKQTESSGAKENESSSKQSTPTVKPPPISSAPVAGEKAPAPGVKTVKGADDSVQTYGVESGASARTQAAIALAAYLGERLRGEWGPACEALATRPKEQLEKLAKSLSAQGKETSGCAGAMAALGQAAPGSPQPPGTTITEVLSLRGGGDISGDPSYLIFTGPPGQTFYSMPMYLQGSWKVGLAVPAELPL